MDFRGNSNPFCIVELGNSRRQTQTQHKTLFPEWNKTFKMEIRDINDALDLMVYDEYKDCTVDFLGKYTKLRYQIKSK